MAAVGGARARPDPMLGTQAKVTAAIWQQSSRLWVASMPIWGQALTAGHLAASSRVFKVRNSCLGTSIEKPNVSVVE